MNADQAESPAIIAVQATTKILMDAADRLGLHMSPDRRVSEENAAILLCMSHAYLKELRRGKNTNAPMHFAMGAGDGSRVSYRVSDLASWIEAAREDPHRSRPGLSRF
jgi:hypothetical protein